MSFRTLVRIKAMQSVYALYVHKKYYLAQLQSKIQDIIKEPSQQKSLLQAAQSCLYSKNSPIIFPHSDNHSIQIVYAQCLQDLQKEKKEQGLSIDHQNITQAYFVLLALIHHFFGKKSKNPCIIALQKQVLYLKNLQTITKESYWDLDQLHQWYQKYFLTDQRIQDYLSACPEDALSGWEIIHYAIKKIFFCEAITADFFHEVDIHWHVHQPLVMDMLERTFIIQPEQPLYIQFPSSALRQKDLTQFFYQLIENTLTNEDFLDQKILSILHHWSLSRVFILDKILIHLALNEMMVIDHIPLKVTLNEYILMAKSYSTEKSSQFINGVLEKGLKILQQEKKINKSL